MRILLVEDDQRIALFIVKGLKAEGFAVDHAENGEDGLHLALTEPYDAAVIDMAWQFYKSLSLRKLILNLNSIGCRHCRPGYLQC